MQATKRGMSNVAAPVGFTIAPAPVPQVVPGDWSSFLLGNNGFNSSETSINVTTAASLQLYWAYEVALLFFLVTCL